MIRTQLLIDELKDFLQDPMLEIIAGFEDPDTSAPFIKIMRSGGAGLDTEGLLDHVGFQVECAGKQKDYDSSEAMAMRVDRFFLRLASHTIGGVKIFSSGRDGSPPAALSRDDADRHRFACGYTLHVQSALQA